MSLHWATDVWLNTIGGVNGQFAASQNVDQASAAGVAEQTIPRHHRTGAKRVHVDSDQLAGLLDDASTRPP